MLWSHCRSINVSVYPNKIVYDIPIYSETIFKIFNYKIEYNDSCKNLRITLTKPSKSLNKQFLS
jgi:hypothetical protein